MLLSTDCFESTYPIQSHGYSSVYWNGRQQMAHRVAWELENGPIPEKMTIDHLCRNRGCVNPDHMEVVSLSENIRRSKKFIILKTHCPRGHKYEGENLYVSPKGIRYCIQCTRVSSLKWYHKHKGDSNGRRNDQQHQAV